MLHLSVSESEILSSFRTLSLTIKDFISLHVKSKSDHQVALVAYILAEINIIRSSAAAVIFNPSNSTNIQENVTVHEIIQSSLQSIAHGIISFGPFVNCFFNFIIQVNFKTLIYWLVKTFCKQTFYLDCWFEWC